MKLPNNQASALVITLALLVLISILVVGFVATARLDVVSAQSHLSGVQAEIFARMGEETALAKLKAATLAANRSWVSQPGGLVVSPVGTNQPLGSAVDLSSGWSTSSSNDETVDLNAAVLENTNLHLLAAPGAFGTNLPTMRVRWVYVRNDGTFDTNAAPAFSASNPVRGRFAYWADDESARIDLNTAWTREGLNTNSASHPSQVSLLPIFGSTEAANVAQYRGDQFFNSPGELKRVNTNMVPLWNSNQFAFTHYTHSPELNMFGEQRILLTTQKSVAESIYGVGTTNFLDIMNVANADPGAFPGNINGPKLKAVMARLNQLLARTDWPIMPGKSFAAKYAPGGDTSRTAQLSLDLIEYVRSKESTNEIVQPVRVDNTFSPASSGDYGQGFTRRPLVSEIGAWFGTNASTQGAYFKVEVYLPKGGSRINLTNQPFLIQYTKDPALASFPNAVNTTILAGPPPGPSAASAGKAYLDSADPFLYSGSVRVITAYNVPWIGGSSRPPSLFLRMGVGGDLATINQGLGNNITYTIDPVTVPFDQITSMAVADPVVNKQRLNWVQGTNSFGVINPIPAPAAAWGPAQDTDALGALYTTGAWLPPPKGQPGNIWGLVESVGELGYLPTGLECYTVAGVPFRTLHLQPEQNPSTQLPDWALLDLFAAPIAASTWDKPAIYPHTNGSTGGRVNLNRQILPFKDGSTNSTVVRPEALTALLTGAYANYSGTPLTAAQVATIQANLASRTLADGATPGYAYGNTNIYYSPWQVAEIKGVGDGGEESEAVVREIGSRTAVRGNVFGIYSVGQAVQQNVAGRITVLSERRSERVVERAEKTVAGRPVLSYQTVFSQNLQP